MPELKILDGVDYTWGWDEQQKPPQLALKLTEVGNEKLKAVFGDQRRPVTMTVITGDGPDYILVKA